MKYGKVVTLCLLLSLSVLGAQGFGFGSSTAFSNNDATLQGVIFDIPSKGAWDTQVVGMLNTSSNASFNLGFKVNRDMGKVYNIKRYIGLGAGISQDWENEIRFGGQTHVGIKIPSFVEGFWFDLEVGFSLSSSKTGKLRGGAFVGGGSSYSF
ncbi:MAG: hypothetical protein PHD88_02580 [Firmicutes bacterium]|nr:hypothetical protein [Bacillota bacterium]MDD4263039.1 hypothetical protein [Bacillota bacterium]MDD4693278.1 hypothetical protein [Bacillota bacterium]